MDPITKAIEGSIKQTNQKLGNSQTGKMDPITKAIGQFSNPDDVATARAALGDQSYNGLCQKFAEKAAYGKTGLYPTAAAAWNDNVQKGNAYSGLDGAQAGDLVYFAPDGSNGGAGHVGIYSGNNRMTSATYNGVQDDGIDNWKKQTGQRVLGYVPVRKN